VLHTSLCPSSGYLTNALHEDDKPVDSDLVQGYKDIFIKVKEWGAFGGSDIRRNGLSIYVGTSPKFVAEFERELDSEPGLAPDARCILDHSFDTDWSM
jgi:hypothetical protein